MKYLAIFIFASAFLLPTKALAHCGATLSGSYHVSCERGVQVYRHNAKSSVSMTTHADILRRDKLETKRYRQAVKAQQKAKKQRMKAEQKYADQRSTRRIYLGTRYNDYRGFGTNSFRTARFAPRRRVVSQRIKH